MTRSTAAPGTPIAPPEGGGADGRALGLSDARFWSGLHLLFSVVSVGVLAWVGREQWFIRDDWIVTRGPGTPIFHALTQHLTAVPSTIHQVIYPVFGLDAYWPYLLLAIMAHVASVHLITILALRCGVSGPAAVSAGTLLLVTPIAADHVLHAINIGFGLAVALPVAGLLLGDPEPLRPVVPLSGVRRAAVALMLLLGMASTSLGLVLSLAVAVWLGVRHGWRTAVLLIVPVAASYVAWLWLAGDTRGPDAPIASLDQAWFFLRELVASTALALTRVAGPVGVLLLAVLVMLGLWRTVRRVATAGGAHWLGTPGKLIERLTPAGVLCLVAVLMVFVVSFQRGTSPTLVAKPRYQHMVVVLSLPVLAAGLEQLGARCRRIVPERARATATLVVLAGLLGVLLPSQFSDLESMAADQARSERAFRGRLAAGARAATDAEFDPETLVDPASLPGVSFADLWSVVADGAFSPERVEVTVEDQLAIEMAISFRTVDAGQAILPVTFVDDYGPGVALMDGCVEIDRASTLVLRTDQAARLPVAPVGDTAGVTVRVAAQDAATGVQASTSWSMNLFEPRMLEVNRPGTILFLRPGISGQLRVCGLQPRT